jgi:hypothetical protein
MPSSISIEELDRQTIAAAAAPPGPMHIDNTLEEILTIGRVRAAALYVQRRRQDRGWQR